MARASAREPLASTPQRSTPRACWRSRWPVKRTLPPSANWPARRSRLARSGPSPAMISLASCSRARTSANARISTAAPFSGTRRPAKTTVGGSLSGGRGARRGTPFQITSDGPIPSASSSSAVFRLFATMTSKAPRQRRHNLSCSIAEGQAAAGKHRCRKQVSPARSVQDAPSGHILVPIGQIVLYQATCKTAGTCSSCGRMSGESWLRNNLTCTTSGRKSRSTPASRSAAEGLAT